MELKWTEIFLAWNSASVHFQTQFQPILVHFSLIPVDVQSDLDSITKIHP